MKKFFCLALFAVLASAFILSAQVTSSPTPLQEDSQDVKIFYHADQGNRRLMGLPPTAKIYAHTGACLDNGNAWVNAPTWGDNSTKYELAYVEDNLWQLNIGDIRSYYGITDPAQKVTRLAFVFRSADNSLEGKTESNGDIFLDLVDSGLQIAIETSLSGQLVTPSTANATFKVGTTLEADITLSVNGTQIGEAEKATSLTVSYSFPGEGDYEVVATASADGETVRLIKTYCYAEESKEMAYPGGVPQMGPVKNSDGSVTFCLGAPLKESVIIVGEWNDYKISNEHVMNYTDVNGLRYFWVTVDGLENDRMYGYYFLIDGSIKVGDPYARLVLDPWNDKDLITGVFPNLPDYPFDVIQNVPLSVYQGNINDYDWKIKDFRGVAPSDLIIYELLFRDFTGTEGEAKGNGTVRQAIEKLPYLKELGVNAVELLPIMEFEGNISWGYNPNFYFAPDKAYGTPDDYKEFIDLCHQNGIAVILDMVFNQTGGLHPWYNMYAVNDNPFYNATAPHAYSVLNDWNQGFPMVQQQWADVIRYWLTEYKFDGFRFDLVKGLGNNDSYANNGDAATNAYNQSRIDRMIALQEIVKSVNPNAYFINENLAYAQEENAMAKYGQLNWSNMNVPASEFAMGWPASSNLNGLYAPNNDGRLWGSTVSYLESHDEQRLAYKQNQFGADGVMGNVKNSMLRLGSTAAQMIMTPGAHMIWQFSEMGNAQNTKTSLGNDTDPKIVNWSLLNEPNHKGLYDSYCELIAIRNNNPWMFVEDAEFSMNCSNTNWNSCRTLISKSGGSEIFTIVNPNITSDLTISLAFGEKNNSSYQVLSKSYNSNPSFNASTGIVYVPANSYVVIGSTNLADVPVLKNELSFKAYAAPGKIVIDSLEDRVEIYSLDGRVIAEVTAPKAIDVASGIYILRSGNNSLKLMVR